ncbi:hypothetical protein [Phocaeicola sp.]|uniref:hypothetical protein n=1 Tax=Phocaeicola sp. TaxID=2773926 RepID=UPI003A8F8B9E
MYWESALQQKRTHPESNRNPGRDPAHLPLMVCSTHCTAVTVLLSQTWDMQFKVYALQTYPGHQGILFSL